MRGLACFVLLALVGLPVAAADLRVVQKLVDSGNGDDALTLLEPHLRANPKDAQALLLRSTAYFLVGQTDAGRRDLDRALALDPRQRQAWLNHAGLAIAEQRWSDALASLGKARELDPNAMDNALNIGAVQLLSGDLTAATASFRSYLERAGRDREAYFLVATNYAVAGFTGPAVETLRRAIAIDERVRRVVRTDPRFQGLHGQASFDTLLETDSWVPPEGSHRISHSFATARYDGGRGPLLPAVLDVLQTRGERIESTVEVARLFGLIWGRLRVKIRDDGAKGGVLEFTAPPTAIDAATFAQLTGTIAREVEIQLARRAITPPATRP